METNSIKYTRRLARPDHQGLMRTYIMELSNSELTTSVLIQMHVFHALTDITFSLFLTPKYK